MTKPEFWVVFMGNPGLYLWIAVIVFSLSFSAAKILRISILHPVVFFLFFNYQFALIAVIYLAKLGYIDPRIYNYFYLSQLSFWLGFILFYSISKSISGVRKKSDLMFNPSRGFAVTYKYSLFLYTMLSLVSLFFFGAPAFAESKWSVYSGVPFAGVIGRILSVLPYFIVVCLSVSYLALGRFKRFDFIAIFSLIFFGALGGSKIFFLDLFFIAFLVYFNLNQKFVAVTRGSAYFVMAKKKLILFLGAALCFLVVSALVYYHQLATRSVVTNPFLLIAQRLVMSGDLQIMVYPNAIIEMLNHGESFVSVVFYELKGLLALLGVMVEGSSLGIKTMIEHYPSWTANVGPASTFDVFFYVYSKQVSLLMSLLVGAFIGFISAFKVRVRNEAGLMLYVIVVYGGYVLIYNPQVWISESIFNILFFLFFYLIVKFRVSLNAR
jgi:hypothetical protein